MSVFNKLLLAMTIVLVGFGCSVRETPLTATRIPDQWQAVTALAAYLPGYETYVNRLPELSLPLHKVFMGPDSLVVYRGLVVGRQAQQAARFICRTVSCTQFKGSSAATVDASTATSPVKISYVLQDSVRVNILLADGQNNATYLLATIDSTAVAADRFSALQLFTDEQK